MIRLAAVARIESAICEIVPLEGAQVNIVLGIWAKNITSDQTLAFNRFAS